MFLLPDRLITRYQAMVVSPYTATGIERIRTIRQRRLVRGFDSRVFGDVKDRRCAPAGPECLISCADGEALFQGRRVGGHGLYMAC